jgi:hypothetical protein
VPRYVGRVTTVALALVSAAALPSHAAQPTLLTRSQGTVEARFVQYTSDSVSFLFSGTISFGDRTFTGTAGGGRLVGEPTFTMNGQSPDGNVVTATCRDEDAIDLGLDAPTAAVLTCTGSVAGGPVRTTVLDVVLPQHDPSVPYHGQGVTYDGTYVG